MPRLPGPDDLGGIPSARVGGSIARVDTSALGEGIASFGAKMAQAGALLNEGWQQVDALNTEAEFQKFTQAERERYNSTVQNMQPGQAAGFTTRYRQEYQQRAREFATSKLATTDPVTHGKYDLRLFDLEKNIFDDAIQFEHKEQYRAANASLDDALNTAIFPRAQMAAALPSGDPRKAQLLAEAEKDALDLIDKNPAYTPIEKEEKKTEIRTQVQSAFAKALPPEERIQVNPGYSQSKAGQAPQDLADRIVQVESGGKANAKNKLSSATGAGQFIDRTWLATIKQHRPDIAQGRSDSELLALRSDPNLSKEMVAAHAADNAKYLQGRGLPVTAGSLYLAHFAGAGGASALLSADPNTPVSEILSADAIASNPTILKGKTAGQVIAWAEKKMGLPVRPGTDWATALDAVPYDDKLAIAAGGQRDLVAAQTAADAALKQQAIERRGQYELGIRTHTLKDPSEFLNDPLLDAGTKATLFNSWEEENKDTVAAAQAMQRIASGDAFNPYLTEDRKAADSYYKTMGGSEGLLSNDDQARGRLVDTIGRTGIIPTEALSTLRGGLDSTNPETLGNTLSILSGIYRANPRAFEAYDGASELRDAAAAFVHLTQDRGLSGEEAAQKIATGRDPEKKANATVLKAGADEFVKKLKVGDITHSPAFAVPGILPWQKDPAGGLTPEMEASLLADYQEIAREKYVEAQGNADIAKAQAVAEMGQLYGVTSITGSPVLMKYPPENYYPPINGGHDYLKQEAFKDAGADLNPAVSNVFLVSSRETAEDIRAGRPPRYRLFWQSTENGQPVIHEADDLFMFPPEKMKELQAEQARKAAEMHDKEEERLKQLDANKRKQNTDYQFMQPRLIGR